MKAQSTVKRPAYQPASSENALEKGSFPAPGEGATGGGATNHRSLPTPSVEGAGRGVNSGKNVLGGGRGSKDMSSGTIGTGSAGSGAKGKGHVGY